ncbi:MAG: putative membrane protein [Oceanicoccus sp.]|jgi:uncharacterized membrane protein
MDRFSNFIRKSIIGGLLVVSPVVILFFAFRWVFYSVAEIIQPLAAPIAQRTSAPDFVVDILVIVLILISFFVVGNFVATGAGKWLHSRFDSSLAKLAPGYNLIRDIIHQFFGGNSESPFQKGQVARIRLFGADIATEVTGIITSNHSNGWYTVFVPTGPNPTSGMIYHLPPDQVTILANIKVDEALRTIIACGAGSGDLFSQHSKLRE